MQAVNPLPVIQVNTTPEGSSQPQKAAAKAAAGSLTPAAGQDNSVMDVLENTLWNRQLGVMSEEIVAALVCQIFEGNSSLGPLLQCHLMHQLKVSSGGKLAQSIIVSRRLTSCCPFAGRQTCSFQYAVTPMTD